jgi:hypothetical protein
MHMPEVDLDGLKKRILELRDRYPAASFGWLWDKANQPEPDTTQTPLNPDILKKKLLELRERYPAASFSWLWAKAHQELEGNQIDYTGLWSVAQDPVGPSV